MPSQVLSADRWLMGRCACRRKVLRSAVFATSATAGTVKSLVVRPKCYANARRDTDEEVSMRKQFQEYSDIQRKAKAYHPFDDRQFQLDLAEPGIKRGHGLR